MPKNPCITNHLKAFIGQTVNIHMEDGSTIPYVKIKQITRQKLYYQIAGEKGNRTLFLRDINHAEKPFFIDIIINDIIANRRV